MATDELPRRRYRWGCATLIVAAFAIIAVACFYQTGYLPIRRFDSVAWRSVHRSDDATRLHMVDSLLWTKRLDGLRRTQVIALLAPPDGGDYFREPDNLVYWLGPERGVIRIDSEWLVIGIGPDGRVSRYLLARD